MLLSEAGVDCLDLSGGICGYLKNGPEGFFTYMGRRIKTVQDIPVMVTGGIKTGIVANEIIASHSADIVGVGRALLHDPDWVQKEIEALTRRRTYEEFSGKISYHIIDSKCDAGRVLQ